MIDVLWVAMLLLLGCFNATAAQDRRVNAGRVLTQAFFLLPVSLAIFVAFEAHILAGLVVIGIALYLWKELT